MKEKNSKVKMISKVNRYKTINQ